MKFIWTELDCKKKANLHVNVKTGRTIRKTEIRTIHVRAFHMEVLKLRWGYNQPTPALFAVKSSKNQGQQSKLKEKRKIKTDNANKENLHPNHSQEQNAEEVEPESI